MLRLRTAFGLLDPGICAAEGQFLGFRVQAFAGLCRAYRNVGFRVSGI